MHTNRLAGEKSPYLQQHAHNPVDWYAWGGEAFERARREDKPIFLSIGYSTCHWCHVMERESFENEAIAELINKWFVAIKVDREERPDIDRIYMSYVQATTGSGGWPMSVWLTPELKPFVGGTYFPPDNRYGRAGFPLVLERIAEAWSKDRESILKSSSEIMDQLRRQAAGSAAPGDSGADAASLTGALDSAFQQFRRSFDSKLGGFGGAPKFPRPSVHNFLLRFHHRTGNEDALDMVATTLVAMEKGGMNDQLGGGFHRYSVDEYWFVPHFEKMLYDQAQLVTSYLEAFQLTGNEAMERAARRTLDYLLRDMTAPEGGFWSAEDADSAPDPAHPREKSEGFFYVWSWDEVVNLLGEEHALWFAFRHGMERAGNVRSDPHQEFTGLNILFQAHTYEETAHHFDREPADIVQALTRAEEKLFEARAKRPRPHLDDYAFFVQGLIDLYEASFHYRYLEEAIRLTERQCSLFEDPDSGGFFASAQPDAASLMRIKDDYDGAEPSGNSVALMNLLRLHRITGREDFERSHRRLIDNFAGRIASAPFGMPQMLCAIEFALAPPREIVLAGALPENMRRALRKKFDPNRVLLEAGPELAAFQPAMAGMRGPAVYVCENFVCNAPVSSEEQLLRLLE